ncbi:IPT/TIG domain-containing protein [Streptomyces sp. NPDC088341]|uniref:IPT/TIG domain-containing protein n=1 Tax=Streptomyces sp. NPDC088341 TaxID=3154870 RepID=UPI003426918C
MAAAVPTVSALSPASGPTTGGTSVAVTGTGFTGATAVRFGAVAATIFSVVSDTLISAVTPAGTGSVRVTVTRPGGTSSQLVMYTYVTGSVPVLTSVVPASGPTAGGTTVTLTGTGLSGATTVRFGATATAFTVVSGTQITAVAPPGTGTVQVTVTGPGGTSNGLPYTYSMIPAPPVVSAVSPGQGPVSGGNTVTLTGVNLAGATAVTFGAAAAISFTVLSPTQITAVVPPGVAGLVDVTVTTAGGTSAPGTVYFYVTTPALTGADPGSGPVQGGNSVTLTGSGLAGTTAVTFGAAPAAFTVISDTQLAAVAPASAPGSVQITVTTVGGTSNGVFYLYLTAPVLTSLTPDLGPVQGGNSVTLTGSGLAGTTAVTFGAAPAAFTVISDTQLAAQAPPGPAGPVGVTVTTPGGTSPALVYTRIPPPDI